jgi:hypothetical protein
MTLHLSSKQPLIHQYLPTNVLETEGPKIFKKKLSPTQQKNPRLEQHRKKYIFLFPLHNEPKQDAVWFMHLRKAEVRI